MILFKDILQEDSQMIPEPNSLSNEKYKKFIVNYVTKQREIFRVPRPMTQEEFIKWVGDDKAKHFLDVEPEERVKI